MSDNWNADLTQWITNNPDGAKVLREKIGDSLLKDYSTGRVSNMERINPYNRAVLYKVTKIETFNFKEYIDPDSLKAKEIIQGNQPLSALPIWLGKNRLSREELARDAKVDIGTVKRFILGQPIRGQGSARITSQLRAYSAKYDSHEQVQVPVKEEPINQIKESSRQKSENLDDLTAKVSEMHEALLALGGKTELNSTAWRNRGAYSIELLAEVMSHYADSSQAERKAFIDYLKEKDLVPILGWSSNIFSGLLKGDDSPETFSRHFRPNNIKRSD